MVVFWLPATVGKDNGGGKKGMSSDKAPASAVMQKPGGRENQAWLEGFGYLKEALRHPRCDHDFCPPH